MINLQTLVAFTCGVALVYMMFRAVDWGKP
jgi:hypothetical protein